MFLDVFWISFGCLLNVVWMFFGYVLNVSGSFLDVFPLDIS